jgi:hypothetical protein
LRRRVFLIALVLLAACDPTPPGTPTPTDLPAEAATIYMGDLPGGAGKIALIVGQTRAQAAACSLDDALWRAFDAWLGDGTVKPDGELNAVNRAGAKLTATLTSEGYTGTYTAADGRPYAFRAPFLTDAQAIAQGTVQGVFIYEGSGPLGVEGTVQMVALAADQIPAAVCAMLYREGELLSRLVVQDVWQAGLSSLTVQDVPGPDGAPVVWQNPGRLGQIDRITLR